MVVQSPRAVFCYMLRRRFRWLAVLHPEDLAQEIALFCHEAAQGRIEERVYTHKTRVCTNVTDMGALLAAARMRLRHIAADYGLRAGFQEKEAKGIADAALSLFEQRCLHDGRPKGRA